jgi:hypothetical protein
VLLSDDLQFGFKRDYLTTHCTFVLNVFLALLDASRAFDRVQYVKLFRLLLNRGLCPMVIKGTFMLDLIIFINCVLMLSIPQLVLGSKDVIIVSISSESVGVRNIHRVFTWF